MPVLFFEVALCPLQLWKEENSSFVNKAGSCPTQPEETTVPWRTLPFSLWAGPSSLKEFSTHVSIFISRCSLLIKPILVPEQSPAWYEMPTMLVWEVCLL